MVEERLLQNRPS